MTQSVGLAAARRAHDLSDFSDELDLMQSLGVDTVELPLYDLDVIVGGRVRAPRLEALRRICAGRPFGYTVHGALAINLMAGARALP